MLTTLDAILDLASLLQGARGWRIGARIIAKTTHGTKGDIGKSIT